MSPAYPRSSHSRKNVSSGCAAAGAMPHASNPISRAFALTSAATIGVGADPRVGPGRTHGPPLPFPSDELPQHVRKNAAVTERHELLRCVDARDGLELDGLAAVAVRRDRHDTAGPQAVRDA